MIAKGLITYGDPLHAAAHIYAVVADGMTLGLFWLLAVMWGEAEAVDSATSRSFTLSALNVFKSWLALCNTRLAMLFFQVGTQRGRGLLCLNEWAKVVDRITHALAFLRFHTHNPGDDRGRGRQPLPCTSGAQRPPPDPSGLAMAERGRFEALHGLREKDMRVASNCTVAF